MKSSLAVVGTLLLLGLAVGANSAMRFGGIFPARAQVLTSSNWERLVGDGKESDAIYGDFVLQNRHLRLVIAQPLATRHANMTVRDVAGAVIDLTSGRGDNDQLAAFYPGKKKFAYRAASFRDVHGKDITPTGEGVSGKSASVVVKAEATEQLPEVTVVYCLNVDEPFVTVTSTFVNRGSTPLTVPLEDDFRADGGKEEMVRSPNATTDRFWLYDRYWGQAYGLDATGRKMQFNSDARVTAIKYEADTGQMQVILEPGKSFELTRRLYQGKTVFHVHDLGRQLLSAQPPPRWNETQTQQTQSFNLWPLEGDGQDYVLELKQGESSLGSVRLSGGIFPKAELPLEPGDYQAQLSYCGNPIGGPKPLTVTPERKPVELKYNAHSGLVDGTITDALGDSIPCKVSSSKFGPSVVGDGRR